MMPLQPKKLVFYGILQFRSDQDPILVTKTSKNFDF